MESPEGSEPPAIGEALAKARAGRGLELREVEAETKIRLKYLRALEEEDWEALPEPAYAVGFLRTYAELLGLDAGGLVAELHEQLGDAPPPEERYPAGEPVLRGRRRSGRRGWGARLLAIVLGLAVLALAAFTILLILDEEPSVEDRNVPPAKLRPPRSSAENPGKRESGPVSLDLSLRDDVTVCLLGEGSQPLIDNQVLNAGAEEEFEGKRFELRLPDGFERAQLRLELDGHRVRLEPSLAPAAFEIRGPAEVRPTGIRGQDCP